MGDETWLSRLCLACLSVRLSDSLRLRLAAPGWVIEMNWLKILIVVIGLFAFGNVFILQQTTPVLTSVKPESASQYQFLAGLLNGCLFVVVCAIIIFAWLVIP
jgi:hypothetical protein